MRYNLLFIAVALLVSLQATAQLTVSSQGMTILPNTILSVDGLTLTPSTALTLVNNTLQKTTTPASTTPQASISRVYQFSLAVPFSGTVSYPYLTSELNGNSEGRLKLLYAAASGGPYVENVPTSLNATTRVFSTTFTSQNIASITAASHDPDLSPILVSPQAFFSAPGSSANVVMNVSEVAGIPTTEGNVSIAITVPIGFSVSFDNSLASTLVSGDTTPRVVNNAQWRIISTNGIQIILQMNAGQSIGARATSAVGFTVTRTISNSGSISSITVNVRNDDSANYDVNRFNNIYARIISSL